MKPTIRQLFVITVCHFWVITAVAQSSKGVDVSTARPLSVASRLIGGELGIVVAYEDVPRILSVDKRPFFPGSSRSLPASGQIGLDYTLNEPPLSVLSRLVMAYETAGNPGKFNIQRDDAVYNVFPTGVRDSTGLAPYSSVMETLIDTSKMAGSVQNIMDGLCEQINIQRNDVGLIWSAQWNFSPQDVPSFTGVMSARAIVNSIVNKVNSRLLSSQGNVPLVTWVLNLEPMPDKQFGALQFIQASQKSNDDFVLHIGSDRPMVDALRVIGKKFQIPTGFEDRPYVCNCEFLGPGQLSGEILQVSWKSSDPAEEIIDKLVEASVTPEGGPKFNARIENGRYVVQAIKYLDTDGKWKPRPPINAVPLDLDQGAAKAKAVLTSITNKLTQETGKPIKVDNDRLNPKLDTVNVSPVSGALTAAQALDSVARTLGPRGSWEILFDPASSEFKIDVYDPDIDRDRAQQD